MFQFKKRKTIQIGAAVWRVYHLDISYKNRNYPRYLERKRNSCRQLDASKTFGRARGEIFLGSLS